MSIQKILEQMPQPGKTIVLSYTGEDGERYECEGFTLAVKPQPQWTPSRRAPLGEVFYSFELTIRSSGAPREGGPMGAVVETLSAAIGSLDDGDEIVVRKRNGRISIRRDKWQQVG